MRIKSNYIAFLITFIATIISLIFILCFFDQACGVLLGGNGDSRPETHYEFHIKFDPNGGFGSMEDIELKDYSYIKEDSPFYTKDYDLWQIPFCEIAPPIFNKFKCWKIMDKYYKEGDQVKILDDFMDADVTYSFKWGINGTTNIRDIIIKPIWEIDVFAVWISIFIFIILLLIGAFIYYIYKKNSDNIIKPKSALKNVDKIIVSAKTKESIYCRKCGKKIFSDSDFCSYCGSKVEILDE